MNESIRISQEKNESDHKERKLDREKSEHKTIVDERSRRRGYPVRPRERACRSYRHTGLCIYGSNCLFNHPRCKFFPRGACKEGSACKFLHEKDTDVPMRQANSSKDRDGEEPIRQSSRRHETRDWVFNIEKKYNRSLSQICDGIVAGYKREKMEKVQRHGQGGLQEQRQRENTERQRTEPQEHRQRDTTEWEKREAQENGHEHRKRDTTKWQRYFENKRREAEENAHEQRLMEIPENHKVDAHGQEDNLKVDRKRESIEWQTREAHEMERRKSKACLEEQRVKAKLDKKRKRDVEKLEVEADKSSEEQRLKENATLDSQVNKRGEEIRSQVIDETVDDGFKRARMERNPDLRPRKPDRRQKRDPRTWAEKRENGNSSLRIKEPDQIPDHKDPHADKLKQPKLRDVERQQQRSHETESNRATNLDRERSEPKTISEDERIQSGYQVRPGERICRTYLQTGLCDHGSNCLFNHPTCKSLLAVFRRGFCKDGSACKFIHAMNNESPRLPNTVHQALPSNVKNLAEFSHPKDRDGAEPMRQATTLDRKFDERKHQTESSSMAEKMVYVNSQEELFTSRQSVFEDVIDDIAAGYKRIGIEHGEGRQRVEAEEMVQEQRNRQNSRRQPQEIMEILERVWSTEELGVG
ncbi:hypothetical protein Bca52824_032548 [Brassica carinata]|uniref:C3H1-type domain-containing protein n=1 Tax=Brassica carinata TaxID=52824 RepID=A0A8X7SDB2_BRACI|nr:hypothetical protein Bca52824_032548 [Brassica carinata]